MSYPQTATTDPYAFSLWPDASEEELGVWAQAAGYAQQELTNGAFSFDGLDTTAAWGQNSTLPALTYDSELQNILDTDWTSGGTGQVGDILGNGASLADATAADAMAFAPAPTPPVSTKALDALTSDFFFGQPDSTSSLSGTPSLTNVSSVPSPQSDGTGNGFIPFPSFEATSSCAQLPSSSSKLEIAGELQPDPFSCPPTSWLMGDGNLAAPLPPNFLPLDLMSLIGNMSHSTQWDYTRGNDHTTGGTEASTTMATNETAPSSSSLGKRGRKSEEDESGRQKKSRQSTSRIPGGAESTKGARRSPVTGTRSKINGKSKTAGCGAGRLAPTTVQGVYRQSLPGHSVSQGLVGALELGQPSWIEEREVDVRHDAGSAVPQHIVLQSAESVEDGDLHAIPGNLTARQRLMLQTTQADEDRGAVRQIRCKLCPEARLGTWETFKRHCKSCERHPSDLRFCPKCGDYFARPDSGIRHHKEKKYQDACLSTSQDEARKKKQMVERVLRKFEAKLQHCLRNGEDIGSGFSKIVNKVLTNTSKKVSKQGETWSEADSWAAELL